MNVNCVKVEVAVLGSTSLIVLMVSVDVKQQRTEVLNGKALWIIGKQIKGRTSFRLSSALLALAPNVVVCGHCLVTLYFTVNETLEWLSSLPVFKKKNQKKNPTKLI